MRTFRIACLLACIAASFTTLAETRAQQSPSQILIPVAVTDYKDRYVSGLQKQDFVVYDNGLPRDVTEFTAMAQGPISVAFVMDLYGDKGNERVEEVATQLVNAARPGDEFSVIDFKNGSAIATNFQQDLHEVTKVLAAPHMEQLPALKDGMRLATERIKQAHNPRKFILIVSDGNAHTRVYSRDEIDALASTTDAAIYTITRNFTGISALAPGEGQARASLDEFTQRTGGRHFTMESTTESRDLAMRISADLRTSYVLGFQSQDTNTTYHQVEVQIRNPEVQFLWARHRPAFVVQK
ncbi:MAG TPA: VWA domain-containing protein [Terriglobia bacterium]|jgi:Ca-activated chloride channel family protein